MKRFGLPVLISILLHLGILLLLIILIAEPKEKRILIPFEFEHAVIPDLTHDQIPDTPEESSEPSDAQAGKSSRHGSAGFSIPRLPPPRLQSTLDWKDRITFSWNQTVVRELRRQTFLGEASAIELPDSLEPLWYGGLFFNFPESYSVVRPASDMTDAIRKRNLGTTAFQVPVSLLARLLAGKEKIPDPELDFMPTETDVAVLDQLYESDHHPDQTELFSSLSPASELSMEQFNKRLDYLVDKGIVTREKVSPEQPFILFFFPIEMKSMNRKNPVYQYKSNLNRQTLMDYFESKRFWLQERLSQADPDSADINRALDLLDKKIRMLIPQN